MSYQIIAPREGDRSYLACFQTYSKHQKPLPEVGKTQIVRLEKAELSREKKRKMGHGRGRSLFDLTSLGLGILGIGAEEFSLSQVGY